MRRCGTNGASAYPMRTVVLASVVAAGCAAAPDPGTPVDEAPAYLALGDSVAFGYNPLATDRSAVTGYPELLAERIGLPVTNASCPGEATGGFLSPVGNDNHCRENRQAYALHADYDGTQLQFALQFLASHPNTQLVTIDIGGNDAGKLKNACNGVTACVLGGFLGMLTEYGHNLDGIFGELRKVYAGPIVALELYNPYPGDTIAQYGLERLNHELAVHAARFANITLADGMHTFDSAGDGDPCSAGLLIGMPDGSCDIHPSPAGAELLADAIQSVLAQ